MDFKEEREVRAAQITRAEEILKSAGIMLSIGSCGCCNSPWVRMTFNGDEIISNGGKPMDEIQINMFPDGDE